MVNNCPINLGKFFRSYLWKSLFLSANFQIFQIFPNFQLNFMEFRIIFLRS